MCATAAAATTHAGDSLASQHKHKLKPPYYDGDDSTSEDWDYKFKAYMGVQHNFTQFPSRAAASTTRLTEAELRRATATTQEAKEWIHLDHNLKYMLIVTTTAAAAIQQLGIRRSTIRITQQCTITRSTKSGSSDEQDKRTIAATSTPQCRIITNICRDTNNKYRRSTSTHNIQQTTAKSITSSFNKLQWNNSTNGHRSNQQRKVQRQRKGQT